MIVIGIDPHKPNHTATVLAPATNSDVGSMRIAGIPAECQRLTARRKRGRSGRGRSITPTGSGTTWRLWLLPREKSSLTFRRLRLHGSVSSLGRSPQERPHRCRRAASLAALQGDARQVYPPTPWRCYRA